jgi:uncharacterized repeat protein (TIGR01451 family)
MLTSISRIAALFGVIALVLLVAVPIASAHHPVVVAAVACDGTVTFTVTADVQNWSRNNPDVTVSDTSGVAQPVATGAFNKADNWSFSGSYKIPVTVTSDTLTPQALGIWGDGVKPSNGPSTTITRPGNCTPPVTTTTATPTTTTTATSPPPVAAGAPAQPPTPSNPAIAISKSPKTQVIASGANATFTIVVTNTGDVPLSNVFVADALTPACAVSSSSIAELATMSPGASVTYTCTAAAVTASFTNVATDTGTPPSGPNVTATDTAVVTVTAPFTPPLPPAIPATLKHKPAAKPPATGSSDFESSQPATAPFTPPAPSAVKATAKPKLVSHVSPTTAG